MQSQNEGITAVLRRIKDDSVAQLVEQMTLNHWVVGSSPTGVTSQNRNSLIIRLLRFSFLRFAQHLQNRILEFHSRIAELVLEFQREQNFILLSLVRAIRTNGAINTV